MQHVPNRRTPYRRTKSVFLCTLQQRRTKFDSFHAWFDRFLFFFVLCKPQKQEDAPKKKLFANMFSPSAIAFVTHASTRCRHVQFEIGTKFVGHSTNVCGRMHQEERKSYRIKLRLKQTPIFEGQRKENVDTSLMNAGGPQPGLISTKLKHPRHEGHFAQVFSSCSIITSAS